MPYLSESAIISFQRWYSGWITNRNQLVTPIRLLGRRVIELFDALLAGNDLEISPKLTLQRRPGFSAYAPAVMNGTLLNTYSWRTASNGVFQIFDTTVDVEYIQQGAATPTVIFTKPIGTVGNKSYMYGVGNYLFVSGVGYAFKWDGPNGTQGVTNWGIAGSGTAGPDIAGNGSNVGTGTNWSNPNNVTATIPASVASVTVPAHGKSSLLEAKGFGFAVTLPVSGIQVSLNYSLIPTVSPQIGDLTVHLLKNGAVIGTGKILSPNAGFGAATLGSASDLWGASWTPNDVNGATFGVAFQLTTPPFFAVSPTATINDVNIAVFSGPGIAATVNPAAGTFSAVNGFTYVAAYGNSVSGEISNSGAPSANTGPFTNKAGVNLTLTASSDPQVNQIHVYRTTDSGGGAIFYELPTSPYPNTSGTVNDQALDTTLQVDSLAATNLQNTPPPANLTAMEWFAGTLWGAVGNLLYFSTGPDSLSGLEQSNWNPDYVFTLPTVISRLVGTPNGMLVHCVDDCYVVRGISTLSFNVNEFIRDIAARNFNAVDTDGSNVYVFTSDRQMQMFGANGIQDIGQVIGDQLVNVDPTQAYVTVHRYGLDSMLFLFDVPNGIIYPYNLTQQAWCLPAILAFTNAATAAGEMEISPGVWDYLIGAGTAIGQRDLTVFSDLGNGYTPNAVVGTLQLADPMTLAKAENTNLQLTNVGSPPTVSIFVNDMGVTLENPIGSQITGEFISLSTGDNPLTEPPTYAAQATNFKNLRYAWLTSPVPEAVQYVQTLLSWTNETVKNEVIGFGVSGKQEGNAPNTGQLPQLQGH